MPLGVYNYTVILTYFGMLAAYAGIADALRGDLHGALVCLMIAGACDMFDGAVAATKTRTVQEKRFGIQIDSLCDLVSFGVLPSVIIFQASGSDFSFYISCFYLLCAVIRLAWFNVEEEERQTISSEARQIYYGLPVTTAALILPGLAQARPLCGLPLSRLGPGALLAMGVAFLSPIPLKKPALPGKIGMLLFGGAELFLQIGRAHV